MHIYISSNLQDDFMQISRHKTRKSGDYGRHQRNVLARKS